MKIDSSILPAYTPSRPRIANDDSLYGDQGGGGQQQPRNIPTVSAAGAMPSGLASALWLTQTKPDEAKLEGAQESRDNILTEFLELSKMTPAERLRKDLLESMGLTEESLAALPPEEREAIEEDIRRALKEKLGIDETSKAGAAEGQTGAGKAEA